MEEEILGGEEGNPGKREILGGVSSKGRRCLVPPHAPEGLLCGRRGAPEGCAIALPRGAGGCVPVGAGGVPLLGTAACPGRPPMWTGGVRQLGVPERRQRGPLLGTAAYPGRPPMWVGGVRWRGCAGGGVPEPCGGPYFPATLSAPRRGSRAGECMPYAAPRYRRSPQHRLRGRARRLAFPSPLRVLDPRLPEPGREECGAHRERLSGHSAGRGIRRMAGRAPARCCFHNCFWLRQDSSGCAPKMAPLCRRSGGTMACHVSVVPPAGRHIVRRAPFLVSSSVGRCL